MIPNKLQEHIIQLLGEQGELTLTNIEKLSHPITHAGIMYALILLENNSLVTRLHKENKVFWSLSL